MNKLIGEKKSDLRLHFKNATSEYLRKANLGPEIIALLLQILPVGARIGGFRAKPDEVNIDPLYEHKGWFWAFPRVQESDLVFYHPRDGVFVKSEWQIDEPNPLRSDRVEVSSLDVMLIPGVAFDRRMQRLGRGRGFYDRALKDFNGLKIGVASVAQISAEELPVDAHDIRMDIIATDKYVLRRLDA